MLGKLWSPASWRKKAIHQDVIYNDPSSAAQSLARLENLPPLVHPTEIRNLKARLRKVALGEAFVLQGGDCAELFDYCNAVAVESKIKLLLQMSLVLIWGTGKPVIRIGRMAGQYAKPRSKPTEMFEGREIPSFRGDIINSNDTNDREPNPERLEQAYWHSAATLNYIRGTLASGLADLHSPMDWSLGHVHDVALKGSYQQIIDSITGSLRFMKIVGAESSNPTLETVELYTSHEGLVLPYEQALTRRLRHPQQKTAGNFTRRDSLTAAENHGWYATSAHFLWVGDRTRQLTGAHIEFFRGIENPIGIKVGPTTTIADLTALLDVVNPDKEIGKVTLITRYGEDKVSSLLGTHIEAVRASGHVVVWQCDPMHGNTRSTTTGIKTRQFSSIVSEVSQALTIHRAHNSYLGGIHLELTGEAVTECVGGSEGLTDDDLSLNYTSFCDPRLNEKQALEMAFLIGNFYREHAV